MVQADRTIGRVRSATLALNEFLIGTVFTGKSVLMNKRFLAAGWFALAAPISIGLLDAVTLRAQTVSPTLTFEVASVRLAPPPDGRTPARRSSGIPGPGNNDPGRFSARLDLLDLVLIAYDIPAYRLSEESDLYLERLDVEAKMPVNTTREQFNVMLQNLLADRLGLKVHWATRQIDTYALVVAKSGRSSGSRRQTHLKRAATPQVTPPRTEQDQTASPLRRQEMAHGGEQRRMGRSACVGTMRQWRNWPARLPRKPSALR